MNGRRCPQFGEMSLTMFVYPQLPLRSKLDRPGGFEIHGGEPVSKATVEVVDQRLAKALSHPLRAQILTILNERVASPNAIANQLGESLPLVSYHVKTLADLGCIELVNTEPRRGAIEHFYRAIVRPFFNDRDWKRLPASARQSMSDSLLRLVWSDVSDALKQGVFDSRDDRHLTRTPLVLDEQGWEELNRQLLELAERAAEIESESQARLSKAGEEGVNTRLMLMHFESPGPSSAKPAAPEHTGGRRRSRRTK
jgi:DNA-binding transcriptional ArsR family regulator